MKTFSACVYSKIIILQFLRLFLYIYAPYQTCTFEIHQCRVRMFRTLQIIYSPVKNLSYFFIHPGRFPWYAYLWLAHIWLLVLLFLTKWNVSEERKSLISLSNPNMNYSTNFHNFILFSTKTERFIQLTGQRMIFNSRDCKKFTYTWCLIDIMMIFIQDICFLGLSLNGSCVWLVQRSPHRQATVLATAQYNICTKKLPHEPKLYNTLYPRLHPEQPNIPRVIFW